MARSVSGRLRLTDLEAALVARCEASASGFLAGVPAFIARDGELPVPVERIADSHCGLLIERCSLRELGFAPRTSGALDPGTGVIFVEIREAERSPGRARFTIAHELGHVALHVAGTAPATIACRPSEVDPAEQGLHPQFRGIFGDLGPETEANLFAAALLMPAADVRAWRRARNSYELAERFSVSRLAMQRRLVVLEALDARQKA